MLDLQALFGEQLQAAPTTAAPAPGPEPTTSGAGAPEDLGETSGAVHPIDAWLAAQDWSQWRYERGRYIGPESDGAGDWDRLPSPRPCAICGFLGRWFDLLGGEHCQRCEAEALRRALALADRAERLRRAHPTAPPPEGRVLSLGGSPPGTAHPSPARAGQESL